MAFHYTHDLLKWSIFVHRTNFRGHYVADLTPRRLLVLGRQAPRSHYEFNPAGSLTLSPGLSPTQQITFGNDTDQRAAYVHNRQSTELALQQQLDRVVDGSLRGDGNGNFSYIPQGQSGISITGDAKSLEFVKTTAGDFLFVGINNVGVMSYQLNHEWELQKE